MRCLSCERLSINIICKKCQKDLLEPVFNKRELEKGFFVYSFYPYEEIKEFINTKYEFYGDRVFNILSELAFKKFALNFSFGEKVAAIPVDDHTRHEFSHTAILARGLRSNTIIPVYDTLKASNIVKYAGRDLAFREKNPRGFRYKGKGGLKVVLVDDLVTTGRTILEAKKVLEGYKCEVIFALTLSDARA